MMDYAQDKQAAYQERTMRDHLAGGKVLGRSDLQTGQALNRPPAIRQRVQEAGKRLMELNGKLSFLVGEVAPPVVLDGLSKGDACGQLRDPTLTSDVDDLVHEISRIEQHVTRLAVAISG